MLSEQQKQELRNLIDQSIFRDEYIKNDWYADLDMLDEEDYVRLKGILEEDLKGTEKIVENILSGPNGEQFLGEVTQKTNKIIKSMNQDLESIEKTKDDDTIKNLF